MTERVPFPWRSPQAAEMKAELERSYSPLSDQEIRARALECASRCFGRHDFVTEKAVLATAVDFEAYIRDGVA